MESLEVICEVAQAKPECTEKYECGSCPYNKNSSSYDLESVNIYKEAKLICEFAMKVAQMGPDAEGVRIRW